MAIDIVPAAIGEKPVLRHLIELYRYDFSEFDGSTLDEHGEFGYPYLDHYWTEPERHPFLIRVDGRWAGFALVRVGTGDGQPTAEMAEFFVLRSYRRAGVGARLARHLFDRFPGPWVVAHAGRNARADAFWRVVVAESGAGFVAVDRDDAVGRVVYRFNTAVRG